MKIIYRTYRFALSPNKGQRTLLSKHFGCVRYIYNHFLHQDKELYLATEKSDRYNIQARSLVGLKRQEETNWLKEVNSQSLQFAIKCLNTAYSNLFSGRAGAPVLKTRKKRIALRFLSMLRSQKVSSISQNLRKE